MSSGAETAGGIAQIHRSVQSLLERIIDRSARSIEDVGQSPAAAILRRITVEARAISDTLAGIGGGEPEEVRQRLLASARSLYADAMRLESADHSYIDEIRNAARDLLDFTATRQAPADVPDIPSPRVHVRGDSGRAQARLLIVAHDENLRDGLRRQLQQQGYVISERRDVTTALTCLRTATFDAVLLDLSLPDATSLDVLRQIRADPELRCIPVVTIGSSADVPAISKSIVSGADDYLPRPFDPVLLNTRVKAALERKRLHELERSRKLALDEVTGALQRSNEDLQRFAYAASHDLQAPVRTITTYLQLLERRLGSRLKQDEREMIEFARGAAKRMHTLIQDLLIYSRASTAVLAAEPIDCQEVLDTIRADLKVMIDESKAEITSTGLPVITGDVTGLRQILLNLITNAIKYRSEAPLRIHVSASAQDGYWRFCVQDNGQGIPPEYIGEIFDMFKRLHGDDIPGSGIGLSICKRIVERFGGRIWVDSEPGRGSSFCFTIPAADVV